MSVEERRRIALHRAATESWGEEVADTLVELVAPSGHELATRADIRGVLDAMEAMDQRWDERFMAAEERWGQRFTAMDQRWDERLTAAEERWDERFTATDQRWDERFTAAEERWVERFTATDQRWDERFTAAEERGDERFTAMDQRWDERLLASTARMESMEHRLQAGFERGIREAITAQTRTLVISQLVAIVAIAALAFGLGG